MASRPRPATRHLLVAGLTVVVCALASCSRPPTAATTTVTEPPMTSTAVKEGPARLVQLWGGLVQPVAVAAVRDDPRVFVVEQGGRVLVSPDGEAPPQPWLDISTETAASGEQGLLGIALHPDFERNGKVYLDYTDLSGDTRIVEFTVDPTERTGPAALRGREEILRIDQPYPNHNGGNLVFGPDRLLYVGTGDGGSANDPRDNAQSPDSLLGKMLRIDVDGGGDRTPEIWALGLRNPWRYSFDSDTGDLWIGDVGQNTIEEVNVLRAGTAPGSNLGWPALEGDRQNPARRGDPEPESVPPVFTYPTAGGNCAVTGGFVYRGPELEAYQGRYFFADYCGGWIRTIDAAAPDAPRDEAAVLGAPAGLAVSSFGEDAAGRLYVVDHGGRIFRLEQD